MIKELEVLRALWVSKDPEYSEKEIREALDFAVECVRFTDMVIGILGTFSLEDADIRKTIIDELFKHKRAYPEINKLWDQEVGNFS